MQVTTATVPLTTVFWSTSTGASMPLCGIKDIYTTVHILTDGGALPFT